MSSMGKEEMKKELSHQAKNATKGEKMFKFKIDRWLFAFSFQT